tara:strand:- start:369 stop:1373 length:1005 start_codon:yes stop_codon:yes gene_type:complete
MSKNNSGLTTLINIGNTCYINSIIQILRHTSELNNLLDIKDNIINNDHHHNKYYEIYEWNNLRKLMWKEQCIISPKRWIHIIKNSDKMNLLMNNFNQQDVTEYLITLLDIFHDSLKRPVKMNIEGHIENNYDKIAFKCYNEYKKLYQHNYSEIIELFYGIEIKRIEKLTTNKLLSFKIEPFSIINLTIPYNKNNISLYDCLDEYCNTEILDKDNMWYNEKTGKKEEVKIQTEFFKLPDILILCIKQYTEKKILVNFPLTNLDVNKYILGNNSDYIYDLYGCCNHIGTLNFGHYTSTIYYNNSWYNFDDSCVEKVNSSQLISPNAYCLFYKKKTS